MVTQSLIAVNLTQLIVRKINYIVLEKHFSVQQTL